MGTLRLLRITSYNVCYTKLLRVIGPSVRAEEVPDVIERLLATYLHYREVEETFIETVERIGLAPFKEGAYGREQLAREAGA